MLLFHAKHVTGEHWGVETFLMRELPVLVQAREEIASEQWSWKMKTVSDELRQRVIGILTAPGFLGLPIIKLDEKKDFFDGPRFLELLS
ncbi:MAG TPA: hypothetical protein VG984_03600 [Candidatus Paceibacterota bacterium]|nr:hypothetical protein [Candidatus Paceibacterota bacterium]